VKKKFLFSYGWKVSWEWLGSKTRAAMDGPRRIACQQDWKGAEVVRRLPGQFQCDSCILFLVVIFSLCQVLISFYSIGSDHQFAVFRGLFWFLRYSISLFLVPIQFFLASGAWTSWFPGRAWGAAVTYIIGFGSSFTNLFGVTDDTIPQKQLSFGLVFPMGLCPFFCFILYPFSNLLLLRATFLLS